MNEKRFLLVATAHSLSERVPTVVSVGRYEVALFNVSGTLHAYENACPHQGGPIAEGIVEDGTVTCPWHAWCFDLRSGKLTIGDYATLVRFEVRIEDDGVYVADRPVLET